MKRGILYHWAVQHEIRNIPGYYEAISMQLADDFWEELNIAFLYAQEFPERHHFDPSGRRRSNLKKFPYHFLFRTSSSQTKIIAVRHDSQNPNYGNRNCLRCEDACQILEAPTFWKYAGTLETLARMVREHCSNPKLQMVKLFQRVLFCWVTGNGDMHLKNWSLIENGPLIELAPAYDLINTKVLIDDEEESALTLRNCQQIKG